MQVNIYQAVLKIIKGPVIISYKQEEHAVNKGIRVVRQEDH